MQIPFWLDFAKTILATFIGAGLAFIANQLALKLKDRADRETYGNLAVLKLGLMIANCHDLERSIAEARAQFLNRIGSEDAFQGLPRWMRTRGMTHVVDANAAFDYDKLFFLLDSNQGSLLGQVHLSAQKHRLLFTTVSQFREIRHKAEERLEEAELGQTATIEAMLAVVGPRICAELNDLINSLDDQLATTRPYLETTANDLTRALRKHFADENWFIRLLAALHLVRRVQPKKTITTDPNATHNQ